MRDRLALGLLKAALNFSEEVEAFHGVFYSRVVRQVLNSSDDLSLNLRCFHGAFSVPCLPPVLTSLIDLRNQTFRAARVIQVFLTKLRDQNLLLNMNPIHRGKKVRD